tara:strand:+ start:251 stop:661 length:411 start_codon:yes stop_codon:yes gene_type:complete
MKIKTATTQETNMTVHVETQCRENYGAHDWDGEGSCPQHWKNKGGDDYVIANAPSVEDAEHFVSHYICHNNEYSTEHIVGAQECADDFHTEMERISDGELEAWRIDWSERFNHPMVASQLDDAKSELFDHYANEGR